MEENWKAFDLKGISPITSESYYDILRFSKALKSLARKSNNLNDFYQRHLVLNLILQLMKNQPTNSKIFIVNEIKSLRDDKSFLR